MSLKKRYRLWTTPKLAPAIVEIIDGGPVEPDDLRQIVEQLRLAKAEGQTLILGPEWEVRVQV